MAEKRVYLKKNGVANVDFVSYKNGKRQPSLSSKQRSEWEVNKNHRQ